MKLPLQARFSAVIVGLIAVLVVNLSGVLYVQFNEIMAEMQRSNGMAMREALLSQARMQAINQARYLSDTFTDDLAAQRIDRLREVVAAAKMQAGTVYILVCDDQGRIVTDGSHNPKGAEKSSPVQLSREVMVLQTGQTLIEGDILHVAEPIKASARLLGEVKLGVSLKSIDETIGQASQAFEAISNRGRSDHIYATAIGMVVLVVLGILLSILISRWLTRPIEADFQTRRSELERANESLTVEIAERHRTEAKFAQLQADLAHIGRLGTVGELAGGLAHELNQPLAVISSYASGGLARLRSGSAGPKEMSDAFERIVAQVSRAGEIIRWIREFVRKGEPRREAVNVNAVIHEAVAVLGQEPQRYGIEVELDLTEPLPIINADKIQIQQTILNLVGNALDSLRGSGTPGRIIVRSLKRGRNHVQVEVEDSGPGLPPDVRDRAFDPFFTTKPNGLGLGLSLCRSIIETHGGELWATSSGERGAIFHFTLPIEELGRRRDDG